MKKMLAVLLMTVAVTAQAPAGAENLVIYNSFRGGSEFYLDLDSFEPGRHDGELYYYVYGFTPYRRTVTLNAVDCRKGRFQSYLKSWRILDDGRRVPERSVDPTPVTLRGGYLARLLRDACQANTPVTVNW